MVILIPVAMANALGFILFLIPAAMVITGIYMGLSEKYGDNSKKPVQVVPDAYIMNIIVTDKSGEYVFNYDMFDPDELTYVIQVAMPGGRREEFETSPYLLEGIGEGMRGTVTFQGNWLSKFEPNPYQPRD